MVMIQSTLPQLKINEAFLNAVKENDIETVKTLIHQINVKLMVFINQAVSRDCLEIFLFLEESSRSHWSGVGFPVDYDSALMTAAMYGSYKCLKDLLRRNVNPHSSGNQVLFQALANKKNWRCVKLILKYGDFNKFCDDDMTRRTMKNRKFITKKTALWETLNNRH
jgi:hypothetical protein